MSLIFELTDRLDKLRAVRASGHRELMIENERVIYRSDGELAAAIRDLERQIATARAGSPVQTILISTSKGI